MSVQPLSKRDTVREFEGRWIDEGYEFMGVGSDNGWRAISGWGLDGWDLLEWPYYMVLFRGDTERATYCEGDITIERFASAEDRERSTDELALWHWTQHGEEWAVGPRKRDDADLRGPFSWKRLDEAKGRQA